MIRAVHCYIIRRIYFLIKFSCRYTLCISFEKLFDSLLDAHPVVYAVYRNYQSEGEGRI